MHMFQSKPRQGLTPGDSPVLTGSRIAKAYCLSGTYPSQPLLLSKEEHLALMQPRKVDWCVRKAFVQHAEGAVATWFIVPISLL